MPSCRSSQPTARATRSSRRLSSTRPAGSSSLTTTASSRARRTARGETPHFDYVAGEAASGLQLAALETGVPVSFGVLTVDTPEQAEVRVDKGAEAVRTALEMADLFAQLRASHAAAAAK